MMIMMCNALRILVIEHDLVVVQLFANKLLLMYSIERGVHSNHELRSHLEIDAHD